MGLTRRRMESMQFEHKKRTCSDIILCASSHYKEIIQLKINRSYADKHTSASSQPQSHIAKTLNALARERTTHTHTHTNVHMRSRIFDIVLLLLVVVVVVREAIVATQTIQSRLIIDNKVLLNLRQNQLNFSHC